MTPRDELAELVEQADINASMDCGGIHYEVMADAILAAGYRKPRTINTVEELDALPVGSVVLCRGRSWQRYEPRKVDRLGFYSAYTWMCPDGGFVREPKDAFPILPAIVLHEGNTQ